MKNKEEICEVLQCVMEELEKQEWYQERQNKIKRVLTKLNKMLKGEEKYLLAELYDLMEILQFRIIRYLIKKIKNTELNNFVKLRNAILTL